MTIKAANAALSVACIAFPLDDLAGAGQIFHDQIPFRFFRRHGLRWFVWCVSLTVVRFGGGCRLEMLFGKDAAGPVAGDGGFNQRCRVMAEASGLVEVLEGQGGAGSRQRDALGLAVFDEGLPRFCR